MSFGKDIYSKHSLLKLQTFNGTMVCLTGFELLKTTPFLQSSEDWIHQVSQDEYWKKKNKKPERGRILDCDIELLASFGFLEHISKCNICQVPFVPNIFDQRQLSEEILNQRFSEHYQLPFCIRNDEGDELKKKEVATELGEVVNDLLKKGQKDACILVDELEIQPLKVGEEIVECRSDMILMRGLNHPRMVIMVILDSPFLFSLKLDFRKELCNYRGPIPMIESYFATFHRKKWIILSNEFTLKVVESKIKCIFVTSRISNRIYPPGPLFSFLSKFSGDSDSPILFQSPTRMEIEYTDDLFQATDQYSNGHFLNDSFDDSLFSLENEVEGESNLPVSLLSSPSLSFHLSSSGSPPFHSPSFSFPPSRIAEPEGNQTVRCIILQDPWFKASKKGSLALKKIAMRKFEIEKVLHLLSNICYPIKLSTQGTADISCLIVRARQGNQEVRAPFVGISYRPEEQFKPVNGRQFTLFIKDLATGSQIENIEWFLSSEDKELYPTSIISDDLLIRAPTLKVKIWSHAERSITEDYINMRIPKELERQVKELVEKFENEK